jgi:hypothetical protein
MMAIVSFKNAVAAAGDNRAPPKKPSTREMLHMTNAIRVNHMKLEMASCIDELEMAFPPLCLNSLQGVADLLNRVGYILYGHDLHNKHFGGCW